MLKCGISQQYHPVAIRVPSMGVIKSGVEDKTDYSKSNKYQVTKVGKDVAVIADELMKKNRLTNDQMVEDIMNIIK